MEMMPSVSFLCRRGDPPVRCRRQRRTTACLPLRELLLDLRCNPCNFLKDTPWWTTGFAGTGGRPGEVIGEPDELLEAAVVSEEDEELAAVCKSRSAFPAVRVVTDRR